MSRSRHVAFVIALLILVPDALLAHVDTIFTISADGTLKEVPPKYQPTRVVYDREGTAALVRIEASGRSVTLPPCLSRLFLLPKGERIRSDGSWYHDRSLLPPYFSIELRQRTKPGDEALFEGHQLLFSLETAELIEITEWKLVGTGAQGKRLDPASICTKSELEALNPRPAA